MKKIFWHLTIINFLSFILGIFYLGGDALNGKEENGRFFLFNHGKLIEVTEGIFEYSKYHGLSVFFSFGMVLVIHYAGNLKNISH